MVLATKNRQEVKLSLLASVQFKKNEHKLLLCQSKFFGLVQTEICRMDVRKKTILKLIDFAEVEKFVESENYHHVMLSQKLVTQGKEINSSYDFHKKSKGVGGLCCLQIDNDANGFLLFFPGGAKAAEEMHNALEAVVTV